MPRKTKAEDMPTREAVRVAIEELTPDPRNARQHDRRQLDGIKASLSRWGQQRAILIDANNVILAGNATTAAATELGWTHIDADITGLEGDEAQAYAVADNRLAELATWEDRQLAETLEAVRAAEIDLAAVGYTDAELDALIAKMGDEILEAVEDPSAEWEGMPEFEHEDKTAIQSVHVHFASVEDVASFAKLIGQKLTEKTKSIWFPPAEIERYADKRYADESSVSDLRRL